MQIKSYLWQIPFVGTTRKELAKTAEQSMGMKATYKKLLALAYELASFTFTKDGTLV